MELKKTAGKQTFKNLRYFKLRNLAWQVLIDTNSCSMPIDIVYILTFYGIKLFSYSKNKELLNLLDIYNVNKTQPGFTYIDSLYTLIFYDDSLSIEQIRFILAHELGHVLLNHMNIKLDFKQQEKEANMFAMRLLCPACILNFFKVNTAEQIEKLCKVNNEIAKQRLQRMHKLQTRSKFLTNELEIKVLNNFKEHLS